MIGRFSLVAGQLVEVGGLSQLAGAIRIVNHA
jgi:hypothetical protein